jgi:hypothetical protein
VEKLKDFLSKNPTSLDKLLKQRITNAQLPISEYNIQRKFGTKSVSIMSSTDQLDIIGNFYFKAIFNILFLIDDKN